MAPPKKNNQQRGQGNGQPRPGNGQHRPGNGQPPRNGQAAPPPSQNAWGPPLGSQPSQPQQAPPSAWGAQPKPQQPPQQRQPQQPVPQQAPQQPAAQNPIEGTISSMARLDINNGNRERRPRKIKNDDVITNAWSKVPNNITSKKGNLGQPVQLVANFFEVKMGEMVFYKYHVDFNPNLESTREKKKVIAGYSTKFPGGYLFDGTLLRLRNKLREETFTIAAKTPSGVAVQIDFKYVGSDTPNVADVSQTLNLICRQLMVATGLSEIRRDYFNLNAKENIPEFRLSVIPGYHTTIRQNEKSILLNVKPISKIQTTQTALNILSDLYQQDRSGRYWQDDFKKKMLGKIVMTVYNSKTYKIGEVDFTSKPTDTFTTSKGTISYMQYYQQQYNISIRDKNQPMLVSLASAKDIRAGRPEKLLLIPELCVVTGLDDDMRKNNQLMKAVADRTNLEPSNHVRRVTELPQNFLKNQSCLQILRNWGVNLSATPVEVVGRELAAENIFLRNDSKFQAKFGDWSDALNPFKTNLQLYSAAKLVKWALICKRNDEKIARNFVATLKKSVYKLGFQIEDPQFFQIDDDKPHLLQQVLSQKVLNMDPQLIMYITQSDRNYPVFKKILTVDYARISQVIKIRTISRDRGLESVATKVGIQMNAKLGFIPWRLSFQLTSTMIVGFDVCHDTTNKSKSFGALVATTDMKTSGRYYSYATAHETGEELSKNMTAAFGSAVRNFYEEHKALPERIIFYRDGVGEGQLGQVVNSEVKDIEDHLIRMYEGKQAPPKFTFIVVTKRHSSAFVTKAMRNPTPGTVVDDVITNPERYDFLLVSQKANKGTASPTIYNVLKDGIGLPPGRMQHIAHICCHLYYNWSGTVRVPMVCQYAHRLAFLCGQHLHNSPNPNLSKTLFFL